MDPILDIRPLRADLFTYSLRGASRAPPWLNDFVGSMAQCLQDAASGLGNYFERVEVQLAGEAVGTVALVQLHSDEGRRHWLGLLQQAQARQAQAPIDQLTAAGLT